MQVSGLDVTGYHAKRKEFDPEYDNDAEVCCPQCTKQQPHHQADMQGLLPVQ